MLKRKILLTAMVALFSLAVSSAHAAVSSVKASDGAILTVSKVSAIKSGDLLTITGTHFDETIGIYVAMCKVVPKIELPTPCGGGMDKTGATKSSIWISSNAPSYGTGLARSYQAGGRFKVTLKVSPLIGKIDCRKIACAIYVRADHLRTEDRTRDMYIPLAFKK
ncbi:MAG: hypothetical protein F2519_06400 [Actinobacteria bacterium]|uniref:Unannotated protein n=1 Tax=freshwater metagenome TaxID=449393 RepID=A0A6J7R6R1_9ZZZZ|nr:hypothetical protein [Actinomycetota bacterium]MTA05187.1 hypothetical protein [Actinomycetota bacterium]